MISDEDKRALADLSLRALDCIEEEYGPDAELSGAVMVFEVRLPDPESTTDTWMYQGNYRSMRGVSPSHAGGMCQLTANWLLGHFEDGE